MRIADCVADYDAISIAGRVCRVWALLVGVAAVFVVGIGCANGDECPEPALDSAAIAAMRARLRPDLPEWAQITPSEPGKKFYGAGRGEYKLDTQKNRAIREADAVARRQIAEIMGQKIESIIKTYASSMVTEEGQISEESVSQKVMRAFTDRRVQGAPIIRRFFTAAPDANGKFFVYALTVIDFEFVATTIFDAGVNPLTGKIEAYEASYDLPALKRKLLHAQCEAYPERLRLLPPIAGEIVVPIADSN